MSEWTNNLEVTTDTPVIKMLNAYSEVIFIGETTKDDFLKIISE